MEPLYWLGICLSNHYLALYKEGLKMKLLNADGIIKELEEHINEFNVVIKSYKTLVKNMKNISDDPLSRQDLYDAGFTDEQIEKFIEIMFKE